MRVHIPFRRLLGILWKFGLPLVLAGFIAYKLAFTWIPLWSNASALEGVDVSRLTVQDEGGRKVPLGAFRGSPLILNFWATWCVPCRLEIPLLAGVFPELRQEGKQLLGINVREPWKAIERFRRDVEIPFPVFRDDGTLSEALGIGVIPALVVIDGESKVKAITYGFRPWVRFYLKWWI
jgi:thiol-disulfide isomerase/thioredoxin